MGNPASRSDGMSGIVDTLKEHARRLRELERPVGTNLSSLVAQVQQALANITTTVQTAISAQSYTKQQIDTKVASPGNISPGTVTASGTVTTTGDMTASGGVTGSHVFAINGPGYNITGGRVAAWLETATGRVATASSSRRYKQDIVPAEIDPRAVLRGGVPSWFRYIEQVDLLGDAAAVEGGFMAEDLEAAGLAPWVVYREVDGEIVPDGVDYVMFSVAQQSVLRWLADRNDELETRIQKLEEGAA